MNPTVLLLGANQGHPSSMFSRAAFLLEERLGVLVRSSSLWRSPSWGFEAEDFLNQALLFHTHLPPNQLLSTILDTEKELGRVRDPLSEGYSSRMIDIDILVYGNTVCSEAGLELPHPRLHLRRFALLPLAEIWPEYVFPHGKTIHSVLEECPDHSIVTRMEDSQ